MGGGGGGNKDPGDPGVGKVGGEDYFPSSRGEMILDDTMIPED